MTTALAVEYYWGVKQGLPEAVGLPFTIMKEIVVAGQAQRRFYFVLLVMDDHQHKLDETNRKTCNPNNNRG